MSNIVNLSGGYLVLFLRGEPVPVRPHPYHVVRIGEAIEEPGGMVDGLRSTFRRPVLEGLPPVREGIVYLLSSPQAVLAARMGRRDCYAVDMDSRVPLVRPLMGQEVAYRRLEQFWTGGGEPFAEPETALTFSTAEQAIDDFPESPDEQRNAYWKRRNNQLRRRLGPPFTSADLDVRDADLITLKIDGEVES